MKKILVGAAAFGCISGPSWAGKTEIPVQSFLFRNPHPVLYVEVTGEDGEKIVWQIEFPPATVLAKRGWTAESFVPGEVIAARGHPSRIPGTYGIAGAMLRACQTITDFCVLGAAGWIV